MSSRTEDSDPSTTAMGPGHSAIVLSSNPVAPEPTPEASGSATPADPVLSSDSTTNMFSSEGQPSPLHTIRRRFTELAGRLEELDNSLPRARPSLHRTTSPSRHATNPSGPNLSQWRSSVFNNFPRPSRLAASSSHSTDASTSLGRRVEARASSARTPASDTIRSEVRDFMTAADTSLALLAQQQQQLLASSRTFRQDPTSSTVGGVGSSSTVTDGPSLSMDSSARRWFARDRTAVWRQNMRERRPRDAEGTSGIVISLRASQGDRPRDATISPSDLSLFPRNRRGNATEVPELEDETDDPANRRSYRIRRRLNPGESSSIYNSIDTPTFDTAEQREQYIGYQQSRWAALSPARIWPDTPTREDEPSRSGEDTALDEEPRLRAYYLWPNRTDRRLPPHPSSRRRRAWGEFLV
ncbi:hypothetical protein BC629DRAFT_1106140 [Irpex lacteus]|nr:hypothetical protein BC629DRAFT_1106140 [Irpex lacteus]